MDQTVGPTCIGQEEGDDEEENPQCSVGDEVPSI